MEIQAGLKLGADYENAVFRNKVPEEFQSNAARIEAWVQNTANTCPYINELREAIEFKRVNTGLLKASIIEECIGDIYALIYESMAETLKRQELEEEKRVRMRLNNILDDTAGSASPLESFSTSVGMGADVVPNEDPMAQYRRKLTTITHREIIRRAESLMIKPPPIATPRPAARTLPSNEVGRSPVVAVVVPTQGAAREVISVPDSPRSLHDSADDESELTDVGDDGDDEENDQEDDEATKGTPSTSMFPNLSKMQANRFGADGTSDVEVYGDMPMGNAGAGRQQGSAGGSSASPKTDNLQRTVADGRRRQSSNMIGVEGSQGREAPEVIEL